MWVAFAPGSHVAEGRWAYRVVTALTFAFPPTLAFSCPAMVYLDDTFLNDVSGYAPWCGWFTSNQSTSAHIAPLESADSAEGLTVFTVISGPPDLSLTVSPVCICALSAMLHSSADY